MTVDSFTMAIVSLSLPWLISISVFLLGVIIYAVYNDEFYPPIFGLIGSLAALHFWGNVPVIEFIQNNYGLIIKYAAYYCGIGVVWSLIKWYLFLLKSKALYQHRKKDFLAGIAKEGAHIREAAKNGKIHPDCRKDWLQEVSRYKLVPKAADNKSRIITWMMYWSFSMVGTLFGDWINQLWNAIYKLFGNIFDRMTKLVYGKEYFEEE